MDISVVSGTYNRLPYLKRMVQSVRSSVGSCSYEIILVDGGSTDGTIAWCKEQEDVVLLEQGELLGAIKAFNAGAYAAQGDYVALLNDDIIVKGNSLENGVIYLHNNPHIGQIAMENDVVGTSDKHRRPLGYVNGYLYGQCSITPRWLGDLAGWWGDEGMRTYGGDARLSLRLWELGYPTVAINECSIIDYVVEDALRKINNQDQKGPGKTHPDSIRFQEVWRGRLCNKDAWIPTIVNRVLEKAARGNLKSIHFKSTMRLGDPLRTGLTDTLNLYGQSKVVDQTMLVNRYGRGIFQQKAFEIIKDFGPDLVIFQIQRENNVKPQTLWRIRKELPWVYLINWDGDTHYPLMPFHFDIARAAHLQLTISSSLFDEYRKHNVYVGYWPIGIEKEYVNVNRSKDLLYDIVFLGSLYGEGIFPEAETRRDAVIALAKEFGKNFKLYGLGWEKVGLYPKESIEAHKENALLYSKSKLALSISQTADLWGYTSDRLYNITATGCVALVQRFAGMEEHGYIDGETCLAWSDFDEMIEKAHWALDNPEERERIGQQGREMTLQRHTWEARVKGLFSMIEGLTNLQTEESR